jgi:hypothetical protein
MNRTLLKQALEALEELRYSHTDKAETMYWAAVKAIRAHLDNTKQHKTLLIDLADALTLEDKLKQKVEELTQERDKAVSNWDGAAETCSRLHKQLAALEAEVAEWKRIVNHLTDQRDALEPDAERYRWIRNNDYLSVMDNAKWEYLDAAIDAAIKEAQS